VRLFVAVWPPSHVLDLIEELPRPQLPDLRWTTRAQWHVTLRFLGEMPSPTPVQAALSAVADQLALRGATQVEAVLGPAPAWFPGGRVLQVPVSGLDLLAAEVRRATKRLGKPEARPFHGHLTLARRRNAGYQTTGYRTTRPHCESALAPEVARLPEAAPPPEVGARGHRSHADAGRPPRLELERTHLELGRIEARFEVREITVVASSLHPDGARYRVVAAVPIVEN
jgi:2'-5' RNA ligase